MKRFIALLLTFALLLFTAVPILCFDIDPSQEDTNTNIDRKTLSYVTDVLPTYFSASKSAIDLDLYIQTDKQHITPSPTTSTNLFRGDCTAVSPFLFFFQLLHVGRTDLKIRVPWLSLRNGREKVPGVGRPLNLIRAILVHHVKAIGGIAWKMVVHRRRIIGKPFFFLLIFHLFTSYTSLCTVCAVFRG